MFVQIGPPLGPLVCDAAPTEASRQSWISLVWTTAPSAPPWSNFHQNFASSRTDAERVALAATARIPITAIRMFIVISP